MRHSLILTLVLCSLAMTQPAQKPYLGAVPDWGHPLSQATGLWVFNDGGGPTVHDALAKNNPAVITSGTWVVSPCAEAVTLSTGNINLGSGLMQTSGDWSIGGWVQLTSGAAATEAIAAQGNSFTFYLRSAFGTAAGKPRVYVTGEVLIGTYTLNDNIWRHVMLIREGSTWRLYINGILDATATDATAISTGVNYLGRDNAGSYPFSGSIATWGIYPRALSGAEVVDLYTDTFCMFRSPLTLDLIAGTQQGGFVPYPFPRGSNSGSDGATGGFQ